MLAFLACINGRNCPAINYQLDFQVWTDPIVETRDQLDLLLQKFNQNYIIGQDPYDKEDQQLELFKEFNSDMIKLKDNLQKQFKNMNIYIYSDKIKQITILEVSQSDLLYILLSFISVTLYLIWYFKSLFLGISVVLQILISCPITLYIVKEIIQVSYISAFNFLAYFFALGFVGSDSLIIYESWQETGKFIELEFNYIKRISYTIRQAFSILLGPNSLKIFCFYCVGLSDVMPISSFGLFSGTVVLVNFFITLTLQPCLIILYEKRIKKIFCFIPSLSQIMYDRLIQDQEYQENQQVQNQTIKLSKLNNQNAIRYPLTLMFILIIVLCSYVALKFPDMKKQDKFLPEQHEFTRATQILNEDFHISYNGVNSIPIYLFQGSKGIQRTGIDIWNTRKIGEVILDGEFDLSPPQKQQQLLNLCDDLVKSDLILDEQVDCWIQNFKTWLNDRNITFPVQQSQFIPQLNIFINDPVYGYKFMNNKYIGLINDKLIYSVIKVNSAVGSIYGQKKVNEDALNQWLDYLKILNEKILKGSNQIKQTSFIYWCLIVTEKEIRQTKQYTFFDQKKIYQMKQEFFQSNDQIKKN
ncbi:hypothetical protein PPERSA_06367 [Pseudocohnilembus persalinus]|uniref:SSD domain-containing protein n=1 Tax=Pseudocohnilembus persalinus TaxID=266149 RepID=A0A0V0QJ47_PSEPJ|nr:hypothetical protein PPERSA_06367 [Pseudocohnilembus persalinus]|eukprot:KRX02172.1 hypothetical protein PPERSA_06367 [Pseudocohnilembus persalinus]